LPDGRRLIRDDKGRPLFRAGRGLSPAERGELRADLAELRAILVPAGRAEIAAALDPILTEMPAGDGGDAAEDVRVGTYAAALVGLPAFAIAEAVLAFLRDESGLNPRFAPTPPELARLARHKAARYRRQFAEVEALLDAAEEPSRRPRSPAALARAEAALARFHGRGATRRQVRDAETEKGLAGIRAALDTPAPACLPWRPAEAAGGREDPAAPPPEARDDG